MRVPFYLISGVQVTGPFDKRWTTSKCSLIVKNPANSIKIATMTGIRFRKELLNKCEMLPMVNNIGKVPSQKTNIMKIPDKALALAAARATYVYNQPHGSSVENRPRLRPLKTVDLGECEMSLVGKCIKEAGRNLETLKLRPTREASANKIIVPPVKSAAVL